MVAAQNWLPDGEVFIESFPLYGYKLEDYDGLFEEKLDLLVRINRENPINWEGKYRAALRQQLVLPRPVNDKLNIWVAVGGTPESVVKSRQSWSAGDLRHYCGNLLSSKPLFDYYREAWKHYKLPAVAELQVGVHTYALLFWRR